MSVRSVCLLAMLVLGPALATGLTGLARPARHLDSVSTLLPRFGSGHLPGKVVGVLQWDPSTSEPHTRLLLWAGGQPWTNLFVLDPAQPHPIDFSVDGRGGKIVLPTGVRMMAGADVRGLALPALVTVEVNRGRGVSASNGFLLSLRPPPDGPDSLASLARACQEDWNRDSRDTALEPHSDLLYTTWDDHLHQVGVLVVRRHKNQVHRGRLPGAIFAVVNGRPFAAGLYSIDRHRRVVDKVLASTSSIKAKEP